MLLESIFYYILCCLLICSYGMCTIKCKILELYLCIPLSVASLGTLVYVSACSLNRLQNMVSFLNSNEKPFWILEIYYYITIHYYFKNLSCTVNHILPRQHKIFQHYIMLCPSHSVRPFYQVGITTYCVGISWCR